MTTWDALKLTTLQRGDRVTLLVVDEYAQLTVGATVGEVELVEKVGAAWAEFHEGDPPSLRLHWDSFRLGLTEYPERGYCLLVLWLPLGDGVRSEVLSLAPEPAVR